MSTSVITVVSNWWPVGWISGDIQHGVEIDLFRGSSCQNHYLFSNFAYISARKYSIRYSVF